MWFSRRHVGSGSTFARGNLKFATSLSDRVHWPRRGLRAGRIASLRCSWPLRITCFDCRVAFSRGVAMAAFRPAARRAKIRKLIFIGFDGLDPRLTERWMAEGKLPNLARLRETGGYRRLRTTYPGAVASGVVDVRHGRESGQAQHLRFSEPRASKATCRNYAMAKVRPPARKWSRPRVESRRRSEIFWTILGRHQIQSTVLRVPVTFPAEKFNGRMLSAMSTPDLKGTQGSFSLFTTAAGRRARWKAAPCRLEAARMDSRIRSKGPAALKTPFRIVRAAADRSRQAVRFVRTNSRSGSQLRFGASRASCGFC